MKIKKEPIAIVGMSCRFPGGGDNPEAFWNLLLDEKDAITEIGEDRWSSFYFHHPNRDVPGKTYTKSAGQLQNVFHFEPEFFGISPRETLQMDPQQRLLLELTWEALEDGGQIPERLSGSDCSVFIGISSLDWANSRFDEPVIADSYFMTGNTLSIAANRISHIFNLRGVSAAIDTACSSSLVAIHQACNSIWYEESCSAIVGGVHLLFSAFPFIGFSKASMLSPDGKCRVFDTGANGYVRSEGGAVFFLKPLSRALADNDPVQALILATGVNTDGGEKSLTVPDGIAQQRLLESVYHEAGINADQVCYIEAHGTGTQVGDPIEAASVGHILGKQRSNQPLLIGSVKSNIGHLEPASGVAGMMKVVLSIKHRGIPASINFSSPNPNINFSDLNLKLVTEFTSLEPEFDPLIMGVNSFGFGGSNAHAVITEYKRKETQTPEKFLNPPPPLFLSANCEASLKQKAAQFVELLTDGSNAGYKYDVFYTSAFHRQRMKHSLIAHGNSISEISDALSQFQRGESNGNVVTSEFKAENCKTAFVFSGNGSQWAGMGRTLLKNPVFNNAVLEIDSVFRPIAGWSITEELVKTEEESRLELTEIAQPLLFSVQVGIVKIFESHGITADALIGHSVGEIAAAYTAGILDLEQAVNIIYHRSEAQGKTKGMGKMAAAKINPERAVKLVSEIGKGLEIGAVNSPESVTFTGPETTIRELSLLLREEKTACRILKIDYAFHSEMMESIREHFLSETGEINAGESTIDFISSVNSNPTNSKTLNIDYWWHNLRSPVLFNDAVNYAIDQGCRNFVEIGPHPVLKTYIIECLRSKRIQGSFTPTLIRGELNQSHLVEKAIYGTILGSNRYDLEKFYPYRGTITSLPSYPWNRRKYEISKTSQSINKVPDHPLLGIKSNSVDGVWTNEIDAENFSFLADHAVDGITVFPGAGFIEMVLAASNRLYDRCYHEINSFEILRPLVFDGGVVKEVEFIIDKDELNFKILGRSRLNESDWVTHAVGKIVREPSPRQIQININHFKKEKDYSISKEQIYAIAEDLGLNYGPAFRCVNSVSVKNNVLLSELDSSNNVPYRDSGYILPPQVLDASFQTLLPLLSHYHDTNKNPYLPMAINNIRVHKDPETIQYCYCELLSKTDRTVKARFLLLNEDGEVVAELNECLLKELSLSHSGNQPGTYGLRVIPKNHIDPETVTPLPSMDDITQSLRELLKDSSLLDTEAKFNDQILPLYDALAVNIAAMSLKDLGAHMDEFTLDDLISSSGVKPEYYCLISYLLNLLKDNGMASNQNGSWKLNLEMDNLDSTTIWRTIIADYPKHLPEMMMVANNGFNLVDLLTSDKAEDKQSIKSSPGTYWQNYNGLNDRIIHEIIDTIKRAWPYKKRRLRIAEIIDNNNYLSRKIINSLPASFCDFCLIATEEEAFVRAEIAFSENTNVRIKNVNMLSDSVRQEFFEAEFDVILVSNWLYRRDDILKKLAGFDYLLASGGLLLIAEKKPDSLTDICMGSDATWWRRSEDPSYPVSRCMYPDEWQNILDKHGYRETVVLSNMLFPDSYNYVVAAKRAVRTQPLSIKKSEHEHPWLIVSNNSGKSKIIAESMNTELAIRGIKSYIVDNEFAAVIEDDDNNENFLKGSYENFRSEINRDRLSIENIIYLNGLDLEYLRPKSSYSKTLSRCCISAVNLLKEIESDTPDINPKFWMVTSDAMHLDSDHAGNWNTSTIPAQAALWGLGRVIRNEYPNTDCRHMEIQSIKNTRIFAHSIINEVLHADDEDEVIFDGDVRQVTRIVRVDPVTERFNGDSTDKYFNKKNTVLSKNKTGKIDKLTWLNKAGNYPEEDEVEITVVAAGLNFRDVMYASGLLPDEMLENGFSGPGLGLECAGVITATGDENLKFDVGDEVIAFAPKSFSTCVITKAAAVVHKPKNWTFEEAATIPTTFFTVYYSLKHLARLSEGEKILIHGAAGGVGLAAIQFAHHCGAEIFATAGTREKRRFLAMLGVQHVFNSRDLTFADEIMDITSGDGVDVVLNSLAGEAVEKNLAILKPFGRFIELGKQDFLLNKKLGVRPLRNNITYFGVDADQLLSLQPTLTTKLFGEMMDLFEQGELKPLPHITFPACDISNAFRVMQQSRHIGKIVIDMQNNTGIVKDEAPAVDNFMADGNATYLITGGLSGFGFATACWLADKGARHIVLISRRGLVDPDVAHKIDKLRSNGINLNTRKCDVSDPLTLKKVFREITETMPPLKGIVHAAMVLEDHSMRSISEDNFKNVFKPKINGAWNLHELTIDLQLDFFIMYSSATTFIGNPGQANYVAANMFLEALARYRNELGLPALAIAWDAIMDTGYLSRNSDLKDLFRKRLGINGLTSKQAFTLLENVLAANQPAVAVMNANWPSMKRLLPIASSPLFSEMIHGISDEDTMEAPDIQDMIQNLSREEIHVLISGILIDEISHILQLPKDRVEHNRSIQDLGIDSLMAMELLSIIETRFGVEIPIMALSDTSTVDSLAARLTKSLVGDDDTSQQRNLVNEDAMLIQSMARIHAEDMPESIIEEVTTEYNETRKTTKRILQ